jgi:hypothetical protein
LGADDIVEGKHLSHYEKKIKNLERKFDEQNAELRLKSQFNDFDSVVNLENIQLLRATYPEIAATISNSQSGTYDKAVSAYTMIKKLGINSEIPYNESVDKAAANSLKPRSVASVSPQRGDSPLSRANAFSNGLTDELKTALWKEMNEARKRQ